jgi:hypothetical protein
MVPTALNSIGPELVIVDRVKKMTQRLAKLSDHNHEEEAEPTPEEIEEEVSTCFNSSIVRSNDCLEISHQE